MSGAEFLVGMAGVGVLAGFVVCGLAAFCNSFWDDLDEAHETNRCDL